MSISNVFDALETQATADPSAGISIAKLLGDDHMSFSEQDVVNEVLHAFFR